MLGSYEMRTRGLQKCMRIPTNFRTIFKKTYEAMCLLKGRDDSRCGVNFDAKSEETTDLDDVFHDIIEGQNLCIGP